MDTNQKNNIIDGKAFAASLRERVADEVSQLTERSGKQPGLAVVLVGDDPASQVYVRNKAKKTEEVGMQSFAFTLPESTSQAELIAKVEELNANPEVHGILVQLPLPDHIEEKAVIQTINPAKDVDGFHVINSGKLMTGQDGFVPCTPLGCSMLLKDRLGDLSGKHAVVIGRSNIVGKPMAMLLLQENCTVTVAHSRTANLPELCRQADIIVAAVGRAKMVQDDWVKPGAAIIDVGINRDEEGKLVGDVDFAAVQPIAGAITPVPGGVGPMTIACLLHNSLQAFKQIEGLS